MSGGLRRGLADFTCRALQATLPPALQSWGWAVRCETAGIADDTQALLFALDSVRGSCRLPSHRTCVGHSPR